MKLHNILIAGLSAVALSSCSDYLDVDAPSKQDLNYVYADKTEINRALNGAYASLLSGDTFGGKFINTYMLNSDVDFTTNSNEFSQSNQYRRFDCDADGGDLASTWRTVYQGIERANIIVDNIPNSPAYWVVDNDGNRTPDAEMTQMMGEAKVIRAILYHELIWMFGDVPFSLEPSYNTEMIFPVVDRTEILTTLINDLIEAADGMEFAQDLTDKVERISKEACWGMIARLALTAGGYSLRPDGDTYGRMQRPDNYVDFYRIAQEYAGKLIDSGTHHLDKEFYKVFVDECNFVSTNANDDVIFELPFGKENTGNVGYYHGPELQASSGETLHPYGESKSSSKLNALYRFSFDENDLRRNYVNQLWIYTALNVATFHNATTVQNGKWSKLWVNGGLGSQTGSGTGINYPYLRYTDVLLMYAEATNEIENGLSGPNGAKAKAAIAEVRNRAFRTHTEMVEPYIAANSTSKEASLKMILDERKWEFAGENMRWRDLVRNNLYNVSTYWTFFRYFAVAESSGSSSTYLDPVALYDFNDADGYNYLPFSIYYKNDVANTYTDAEGNTQRYYEEWEFPNQNVNVVRIANPYKRIPSDEGTALNISRADYMNWFDENLGLPKTDILYSLRGYIYCDRTLGQVKLFENGNEIVCPTPDVFTPTPENLPVVRYIMPYPRTVISHSSGQYVNKYGYR